MPTGTGARIALQVFVRAAGTSGGGQTVASPSLGAVTASHPARAPTYQINQTKIFRKLMYA